MCLQEFNYVLQKYYTWNSSNGKFSKTKQGASVEEHPGIKASDNLDNMYTVHPNQQECYYLHLLLCHVRGTIYQENSE